MALRPLSFLPAAKPTGDRTVRVAVVHRLTVFANIYFSMEPIDSSHIKYSSSTDML